MASYSQIGYGSKGSDVTALQRKLNQNGYQLDVDGNFGPETQKAVKDYQKTQRLDIDGVVGKDAWGMLNSTGKGGASSNAGAAAPAASAADMEFSYDDYRESDTVQQAQALLQQQMASQPGAYQSAWQDQIGALIDQITNREKFSYDLNADALYQQYADQYATQGKLAMMDTMGQAAAMTGGYGNSYAQSVGQQTYQGYLQKLNEVVPELYQMAQSQYNQEGQDMLNQYSLLSAQDEQEYGRYRDEVADYYTQLQQAYDQYNTERNYDYGKYTDERDFAYGDFSDDRGYAYQSERDAVADEQWLTEFEEAQRQYDEQMELTEEQWAWEQAQYEAAQSAGSGRSGGGSSGGSSGSGSSGSGSSGGSNNANGNADSKKSTGSIPDNIVNRASGYTDNNDLANYLDGLTASGTLTDQQADSLYAQYKQTEKAALNERSWTLVDDGGINWFWGVDNDAKVKDQYGNTYRLDKLVDALVEEGMSKSDAKAYVKSLQKRLGG